MQYFFVDFGVNKICLVCKKKLAVLMEYNLKRHYATKHGEYYENYKGDDRKTTSTAVTKRTTIPARTFSSKPVRMLMLQFKQVKWVVNYSTKRESHSLKGSF